MVLFWDPSPMIWPELHLARFLLLQPLTLQHPSLRCCIAHVSSRNSGAPKPSASRAQCRCSARCSSCTRLYDAMEDFLSFVFSGQQAPIWLFRFSRLTPYQAGKPPPRMSNHVVNNNNSSIHHPKFWSRKRKRHREIGSSNFWSPTPVETLW